MNTFQLLLERSSWYQLCRNTTKNIVNILTGHYKLKAHCIKLRYSMANSELVYF